MSKSPREAKTERLVKGLIAAEKRVDEAVCNNGDYVTLHSARDAVVFAEYKLIQYLKAQYK